MLVLRLVLEQLEDGSMLGFVFVEAGVALEAFSSLKEVPAASTLSLGLLLAEPFLVVTVIAGDSSEAALACIEMPSASSPILLSFFMVISVDMLEATLLAPLALVCEMVPADIIRLLRSPVEGRRRSSFFGCIARDFILVFSPLCAESKLVFGVLVEVIELHF